MQQTANLSNSTPAELSPSFQAWLDTEKAAAHAHRQGILKMTAFVVAIIAILLVKDQGVSFQEIFDHVAMIGQP